VSFEIAANQVSGSTVYAGDLRERTYTWCTDPGVSPPCDSAAADGTITAGGAALVEFDVNGVGDVTESQDRTLNVGDRISLTPGSDNTLVISNMVTGLNTRLCGAKTAARCAA